MPEVHKNIKHIEESTKVGNLSPLPSFQTNLEEISAEEKTKNSTTRKKTRRRKEKYRILKKIKLRKKVAKHISPQARVQPLIKVVDPNDIFTPRPQEEVGEKEMNPRKPKIIKANFIEQVKKAQYRNRKANITAMETSPEGSQNPSALLCSSIQSHFKNRIGDGLKVSYYFLIFRQNLI